MLALSIVSMLVYHAFALKSLTPKLEIKNYDKNAFRYQADEYAMDWERSWAVYYDTKDEFHGFMSYLFDYACKAPKRIAIEPSPFQMLVCAHKCRDGYVSVLKQTNRGKRKRICKRDPYPDP